MLMQLRPKRAPQRNEHLLKKGVRVAVGFRQLTHFLPLQAACHRYVHVYCNIESQALLCSRTHR